MKPISKTITVVTIALVATGYHANADLAFETETARPIEAGKAQVSGAAEYLFGKDGKEFALPLALEYGLIKDLEILFEPIPYASVRGKGEKAISGVGDTEFTLNYLAIHEQNWVPAISFATEVKVPTAAKLQLGSGEYDYRFFMAASKRIGPVDFHANVGYNVIGSPSGVNTRNPLDLSLAAEWFVCKDYELYAEINYQGTSLGSGNTTKAATVTPEVGGKTIVGTAGIRYHLTDTVAIFTSYSYDNSKDNLIRLGASWNF